MKQLQAERLELYRELIHRYHQALDLMSSAALLSLEEKLADASAYADALEAPASQEVAGPAEPLLDLGSGVGLPGIPLAIRFPERATFLIERRSRRASFLRIAVAQLGLEAVTVLNEDVRDVALHDIGQDISIISSQAVAAFSEVYCLTRHLHAEEVVLLSRKGESWQREAELLARRVAGEVSPVYNAELTGRGRLVALRLAGGLPCLSSASSIKKGV